MASAWAMVQETLLMLLACLAQASAVVLGRADQSDFLASELPKVVAMEIMAC